MLRKLLEVRYLPPNVAPERVWHLMCGMLAAAVFWCGIHFAVTYSRAYQALFQNWGTRYQTLDPTVLMLRFGSFALDVIRIIAALMVIALLSAVMLYSSYYQGSRSIYLMRRLPDGKRTLRRQVWSAPLRTAMLLIAAGMVLIGIFYLLWRFVTPEPCLPTAENLQRAMQAIADSPYSAHAS